MIKEKCQGMDEKILQQYQILQKLGQGGYGEVWKVRNKQTSSIYALKRVYDAFRNSIDSQRTYREIKYLQKLNHPNIVSLINFSIPTQSKDLYITLECLDYDLSSVIKFGILKEIHRQFIFYQIVNGVLYLHSAELIHRDLKPSNILINQNSQVKLCDLGLIRSVFSSEPGKQVIMTQNIATRWYRAPQLLLCSNNYGKPIDIWGLGCILSQMYLGKPIFKGTSAVSQLEAIFSVIGKPTKEQLYFIKSEASKSIVQSMNIDKTTSLRQLFSTEDKNMVDLLEKIFIIDPMKRIKIEEILTHPFVGMFLGVLSENRANQIIKILYDDKLLTPENYRLLLKSDLEDNQWKKSQAGRSNPSTYHQSTVTQSLPNNSRQLLGEFYPLSKMDRFSPQKQIKKENEGLLKKNISGQLMKKEYKLNIHRKNKFEGEKKETQKLKNSVKFHQSPTYPVLRVHSPFRTKNNNDLPYFISSRIRHTPSPKKAQKDGEKKQLSLEKNHHRAQNIGNQRLFGRICFTNLKIIQTGEKSKMSPERSKKKSLSPSSMMDRKVTQLFCSPSPKNSQKRVEEKRDKVPNFIRNRVKYKSKSPKEGFNKTEVGRKTTTEFESSPKQKKPCLSQKFLQIIRNNRRSWKFLKTFQDL